VDDKVMGKDKMDPVLFLKTKKDCAAVHYGSNRYLEILECGKILCYAMTCGGEIVYTSKILSYNESIKQIKNELGKFLKKNLTDKHHIIRRKELKARLKK